MQVICDETLRSTMMIFVTMPDFVIEKEGCRIVTTDLWWNENIRHKKRSSMTILDPSLRKKIVIEDVGRQAPRRISLF